MHAARRHPPGRSVWSVKSVIRQFTIGCSHTLNRGNFNSLRIEAQLVIEVPEGDDLDILKEKAQGELRRLLEETYRAQARFEMRWRLQQ